MSNPKDARFPLRWPDGWPRTTSTRKPAAFRRAAKQVSDTSKIGGTRWIPQRPLTMAEAMEELEGELTRLGAALPVLSTNVKLTIAGTPYSGLRQPDDPGAALYFRLKGRQIALACDKWNRVEDNITAIARHIEALRGQERWGVGSVERAFSGYARLPAATPGWRETLGVGPEASAEEVKARWRELAKREHPEVGGSHERWLSLSAAYQTALKELLP